MVLIMVFGKCCPHIDVSEAQKIFRACAEEQLLKRLLETNRADINFVFDLDVGVEPSEKERFVVTVDGDLTPSEHAAKIIAACCNAAFYCRNEHRRIETACFIHAANVTKSATTSEVVKRTYHS